MSTIEANKTADLLRRREAAIPRGPYNVAPIFVESAEGSLVRDVDGKEYIDFAGGIGVLNVGHNHPKVVAAIQEQSSRLVHSCWHVAMYESYVRLAERLNEKAPVGKPAKTLFFNSGAEAVENAVKIARIATGRSSVLSFEKGYHGRTLLTMTLTGKVKPYTNGFGPFAPGVYRLPHEPFFMPASTSDRKIERDALTAIEHAFSYRIEPESVACIILEPVLGEGGFVPVHPAAMRVLRQVCDSEGILLVADEVQSGFGRCGALFAMERYGLQADLITMAKSLSGGLPLSAVTGRAEVMDASHVGGLGGTFGGNPVACAAANAVLDIMEEEDLPARANEIGEKVMAVFRRLALEHEHVGQVRGLGAMCGMELVDPKKSSRPDAERAGRVVDHALKAGLILMTASGNVIRTLMPLTISSAELDRGLDILAEAVGRA